MARIYKWLCTNKLANILLVIVYYLAVVLPHEQVGAFINRLFVGVTRDTYNKYIVIIALIVGLVIAASLYKKIRRHPDSRSVYIYLVVTLLLVLLCFNVLFVINIEAIHFVQYAILAILVFPLFKNSKDTIAIAILLGAIDELYQYLVLDTTAQYYDFNDVFLDCLGAGMGLLLLKILSVPTESEAPVVFYKTLGMRIVMVISAALLLMYLFGLFSVNMNPEDPAFFTLVKRMPEGFWHYPKGPYARYHLLEPIPGLCLIFATAYFYARLDRLSLDA